jgi:hypothetical protein
MRDHASTTYVGSFEPAADFGARVRQEALRRGLGLAKCVALLGDGAAWIWELARVNFPMAILILDLYHALERLHDLCQRLYGADSPWAQRMKQTWTATSKATVGTNAGTDSTTPNISKSKSPPETQVTLASHTPPKR